MDDCGSSSVVNNFINSSDIGVNVTGSSVLIYYNSVNIEHSSGTSKTTSSAFRTYSTTGTIMNNIFKNTRQGYAYMRVTGGGSYSSNYNNLSTNGSNIGFWLTTGYTTFSGFQTGSGTNTNSYSADIIFNSISDLHVQSADEILYGTMISGITVDIDGETRNNPPYIGADEPMLTYNLNITTYLEGPYNGPNMNTALTNSLPKRQPYSAPIHSGTESVTEAFLLSNQKIVDWIVVELRSDINTKVTSRAGFLLNNGQIVDLDGTSNLQFNNVFPGSYYFVVHQRNHLSIMSALPQLLN